jgi:hypothetical protein
MDSNLGEYQDRRNLQKVDCSKTIWILATNSLDDKIRNFCRDNGGTIWDEEDENKQTRLIKALTKELKDDFIKIFQVRGWLSFSSLHNQACHDARPS